MLKRTLLATCVGILLVSQNVQAGDTAQNGAWGGAAGGAILGQAIGRNTKGTLLGTAIGGVLGYMVGNEMEKGQGQSSQRYYPPPRMVQQYEDEDDYQEVQVYERPVVYYYTPQRVVRQTVIIDRDRDCPPRFRRHRDHDYQPNYRGQGREHWEESNYRPAYQGYPGR